MGRPVLINFLLIVLVSAALAAVILMPVEGTVEIAWHGPESSARLATVLVEDENGSVTALDQDGRPRAVLRPGRYKVKLAPDNSDLELDDDPLHPEARRQAGRLDPPQAAASSSERPDLGGPAPPAKPARRPEAR